MHHQNIRALNTLLFLHCNPKKETESKGKGPETETEDREGGSQENIQNCKIVHKEKKGRRPQGEKIGVKPRVGGKQKG